MTKTVVGISVHYDDKTYDTYPIEKFVLGATGGQSRYNYIDGPSCPDHGPWKAVPAGISGQTGKPYNAFWSCDTEQGAPRCNNRAGKPWTDSNPPATYAGTSAQASSEPVPSTPSAGREFDDLPF